MRKKTAPEKAMERIASYLFYNPWSTTAEIAGFASLPRWRVQETAVDFPEAFEQINVPRDADDGRVHDCLYALTARGQRRWVGRFRSPRLLASALLMYYRRLAFMREMLLEIKKAGRLNWVASPWIARRKGMLFDAIASLSASPGSAILGVFSCPPAFASLLWYEALITDWIKWRNKGGSVQPANLYLYRPTLENQTVSAYLTRKVEEQHGNIVVFGSGEKLKGQARWRSITRNPISAVPELLLSPKGFVRVGVAKNPYPKATSLQNWAEANREEEELAGDVLALLSLGVPELAALERIALHPPATIPRLRAASGSVRDRNQMRAKVRRLENQGLVCTRNDAHATITITQSGISLMGALAGVSPEMADELLGWPNRPRTYAGQPYHYQRITGFLLWLHRAGRVADWSTMKCRYRFRDVSVGPIQRRVVTIHPDGEGDFVFEEGRKVRFWLEVDRGTRTGRRYSAQLEKYYLIRYARTQVVNIPPLLYITDTGKGSDEGRLRSAARRLVDLGRLRYPGSGLEVLFTTGDLIDRFAHKDPGVVRIWRRFSGGRLDRELVSLEEGLVEEKAAI